MQQGLDLSTLGNDAESTASCHDHRTRGTKQCQWQNRYASTYHFIIGQWHATGPWPINHRTMACNKALTYHIRQWCGVDRIMPWSSNTWYETMSVTNRYASTYHFINRTMACNRALTYHIGQWCGVNRIMPWSLNTWYETMPVTNRYASTFQHRE